MLTSSSIERIKEIPISSVIGKFIDLKKKGVNFSACCPFHGEKTPSFSVSDVKEIYKCFGCGVSGDSIQFVMQHQNLPFIDACKLIARNEGIDVEFEERELTEKEQLTKAAAELQEEVMLFTIGEYQKAFKKLKPSHPAKQWLYERGITDAEIEKWQIGWASQEWHSLTPKLINMQWYEPGFKLGLIKKAQADDRHYDGYRSRITFPIKDRNGRFIGMGGRYIKINPNDPSGIPKYINPPECELYNKSTALYGLDKAMKGIRESGFACLVEGYMDVISPHRIGIDNVVATCGTALTDRQISLLKRYTAHVVLWRDNDAAGTKSIDRDIPALLKAGFRVDVMNYSGKDPDEWSKWFEKYINSYLYPGMHWHEANWDEYMQYEDAVLYRANQIWDAAAESDDIHKITSAKTRILELLSNISNEFLRSNYLDNIVSSFKWKAADAKKQLDRILESTEDPEEDEEDDVTKIKFADWMTEEQKEEVMRSGYVAVNRVERGKKVVGYYSFTSSGKTEITNFLVNPRFRIEAGQETRYLCEIDNGYNRAPLDVRAKMIPSIDQFQGEAIAAGGAMLIYGTKNQWLRIATDLLHKFPSCKEIVNLGFVRWGFFAWVDKVYLPGEGLKDLDNWGIAKFNNQNYLVAAACEAYRELQDSENDVYESDRALAYKISPVKFQEWANQMHRVWEMKGIVGIAYSILTVFRDIVFDIDNNCPHLYAFGEPSSGKSKWAESITSLFYYKRSAFNLNSGTSPAFFNYMRRFRNCPAHLNEFDIEVIDPQWFQAIKGVFDGEGRERTKASGRNQSEVMHVKGTLVLTGQKLVTADDNSVVTRSIIEPFSIKEFSEEDKLEYNKLKGWESQGMSSMLEELLIHRSYFVEHYRDQVNALLSRWRRERKGTANINTRLLSNYVFLSVAYSLASAFIQLPVPKEEFEEYCYGQAFKWSKFIKSSDTLSVFWKTMEQLVNRLELVEGWDYVIAEETKVKIRNGSKEEPMEFPHPTKVIYVRINNVHPLFQADYKKRTGDAAMSLENLMHYFESRPYFLGAIKQKKFKRYVLKEHETRGAGGPGISAKVAVETTKQAEVTVASCYAFLYDELGMEIERFDGVTDPDQADQRDESLPFPKIS